jgi:methionyl-tRNA formyltransferase
VLHPGICPEYRNSHGCFWAMAGRDLRRVGMTLLKIDRGVDTGPVYLQASCDFNEVRESHVVIQYRVITENLDRIADKLIDVCKGRATPVSTAGRKAGVWGQPRLSAYFRWKRQAHNRHDTHRLAALS